jgi:hypothetical protein
MLVCRFGLKMDYEQSPKLKSLGGLLALSAAGLVLVFERCVSDSDSDKSWSKLAANGLARPQEDRDLLNILSPLNMHELVDF